MSLYNMVNGVCQATFFILPMLGKHPDEYPRFRDCFIGDEDHDWTKEKIIVYTRTGGGNRESYIMENQEIRDIPGFIADYDDSFDCTYAKWVFDVPEQWKPDFERLMNNEWSQLSDKYWEQIKGVFPKLADKFEDMRTAEDPNA